MIGQVPYPATKMFVLDTNVILHDAGCLRNFEDNDIAVPITVLEELDRFKKGNEDINFQARAFLRRLDELTGDVLSPDGVSIGEGLGNIRIAMKANHRQQIDHPYLDSLSNGLSYLIDRMVGQPLFAHVTLEKGERSELAELASNLL